MISIVAKDRTEFLHKWVVIVLLEKWSDWIGSQQEF